ncbi:hypothetical protein CHS0354_002522 [Potamilus streckersoni]|uniref:Uncharacterized protein n=1 Tax=Potamilus streckersoni TaxID=2493646 RepID=A0AAE0W0T9_9BIVA|nr:hypothetical protein CHS0354_002522 [Potamilus streckersoni]
MRKRNSSATPSKRQCVLQTTYTTTKVQSYETSNLEKYRSRTKSPVFSTPISSRSNSSSSSRSPSSSPNHYSSSSEKPKKRLPGRVITHQPHQYSKNFLELRIQRFDWEWRMVSLS